MADEMSDAELLRAAIDATHQSNMGFARLIESDDRTVRRWLSGEREMFGPIRVLCRLLISRPSLVRLLGGKL